MKGFVDDIEKLTEDNGDFRRVLYTGRYLQLVLMTLQPGDEIGAEDPFGTVEAVKTVSELFAPLAGTMEAINEALEDAPETVNSDPYGEGWMIKIRPADEGDLDGLMSAEEYAHMIGADS